MILKSMKIFVHFLDVNYLKFRWLEWIEKARKPFEKNKPFSTSINEKSSSSSISTLR
jgi:hypothetical protein